MASVVGGEARPAAPSRCPASPPTPEPRQVRPRRPRARQPETAASREWARPARRAGAAQVGGTRAPPPRARDTLRAGASAKPRPGGSTQAEAAPWGPRDAGPLARPALPGAGPSPSPPHGGSSCVCS